MNKAQIAYDMIDNQIFEPLIETLAATGAVVSRDAETITVTFDDQSVLSFNNGFASASVEETDYRNKFVVAVGDYEDMHRNDPEKSPRWAINWTQVHIFDTLDEARIKQASTVGGVVEINYVDGQNDMWTLSPVKRIVD